MDDVCNPKLSRAEVEKRYEVVRGRGVANNLATFVRDNYWEILEAGVVMYVEKSPPRHARVASSDSVSRTQS